MDRTAVRHITETNLIRKAGTAISDNYLIFQLLHHSWIVRSYWIRNFISKFFKHSFKIHCLRFQIISCFKCLFSISTKTVNLPTDVSGLSHYIFHQHLFLFLRGSKGSEGVIENWVQNTHYITLYYNKINYLIFIFSRIVKIMVKLVKTTPSIIMNYDPYISYNVTTVLRNVRFENTTQGFVAHNTRNVTERPVERTIVERLTGFSVHEDKISIGMLEVHTDFSDTLPLGMECVLGETVDDDLSIGKVQFLYYTRSLSERFRRFSERLDAALARRHLNTPER